MARHDALLKLHKTLVQQRDALMKKFAYELEVAGEESSGDAGDLSAIDTEQELGSQLAAIESRELVRIEKAIHAIRVGTYGQCELCDKPIPIARLKALPHTTCCIQCQRNQEQGGEYDCGANVGDWESAWEFQARRDDQELTARDVKMDTD